MISAYLTLCNGQDYKNLFDLGNLALHACDSIVVYTPPLHDMTYMYIVVYSTSISCIHIYIHSSPECMYLEELKLRHVL